MELGKKAAIEKHLLEDLERLTYTYLDSRYPDTTNQKYTSRETQEDIKIAEKVLKWIKRNI